MINNMPIILNILLMLYVLSATTVTRAHPTLEDLDKYEIHSLSTYSHMNNARNGRKLMQSRGERKLSYEFEAFGRVLALELTRDDELFASEYKHYFVVPKDDGSHEYIVDEKVDTKCHYKAIIKDDPQSIGRISLCGPGMRALFKHSEIGQFHIEPMNDKGDEHVVYRALDVKKSDKRGCGVDDSFRKNRPRGLLEESDDMKSTPNDKHNHIHDHDHDHNHNHNHDHHHSHEEKAAEQAHERRELVNLPDKLIRLVVVNDYLRFQQTGNKVHTHAASLVASMDSIYSTFGGTYTFDLQIVAMFTYSIKDPYSVTISSSGYPLASNILNPFSDWANNRGASFPVQFSHAMLFSGYNFDGTTIGLAWLGTTCTTWAQSIVQTVALKDSIIALAAAHELGHNLGMDHDSSSYPCYGTNSPYIMDPSVSNTGVASWSQCSVDRMKSVLEGDQRKYDIFGYPACMEKCFIGDPNPPSGCVGVATRNVSIPECGDGFREGSEECDCPNKDCSVIDPCCDGATCKLKVGSACSLLDPCCSSSCQIVTDTTQICRASTGECDIADKCDGVNAKCPPDDFLQIGSPCTLYSKPGTCFNKDCVSHWGMCYEYGGPGYYESDCSSRNNDDGDAACGNIHCKKANSFGCTYYTTVWVKDGIQCGAAKACLNQVCTDYSSFPNQPTSTVSPTVPTQSPTKAPTKDPTKTPTKSPTNAPTKTPTKNPTNNPSKNPTTTPTTVAPTLSPTTPTLHPTATPTTSPTFYPTLSPTSVPTTTSPTSPTPSPSFSPSLSPSASPTVSPTTAAPTSNPTTPNPTSTPSASPTASPTTAAPTFNPTTPNPTTDPSLTPSTSPTTSNPSSTPTITPSSAPSSVPTTKPTKSPTKVPTTKPTNLPSKNPTNLPSNPPTTSSPISSPTKSPLTLCKYDTKKKCKKDSKCLWLKKICTVSECALLTSKTDCIANLKCSWKKNVCKLK